MKMKEFMNYFLIFKQISKGEQKFYIPKYIYENSVNNRIQIK